MEFAFDEENGIIIDKVTDERAPVTHKTKCLEKGDSYCKSHLTIPPGEKEKT